jgi:hypothetical protein
LFCDDYSLEKCFLSLQHCQSANNHEIKAVFAGGPQRADFLGKLALIFKK